MKTVEVHQEAMELICTLCKRLNPQHTGNPSTCDCGDIQFLRKAIIDGTNNKAQQLYDNPTMDLDVAGVEWCQQVEVGLDGIYK